MQLMQYVVDMQHFNCSLNFCKDQSAFDAHQLQIVFCSTISRTALLEHFLFLPEFAHVHVQMRHLQAVALFGFECPTLLLQHLDRPVHVHHLLNVSALVSTV
jgi:hypothetical protein